MPSVVQACEEGGRQRGSAPDCPAVTATRREGPGRTGPTIAVRLRVSYLGTSPGSDLPVYRIPLSAGVFILATLMNP